jgi:hypothetical protein
MRPAHWMLLLSSLMFVTSLWFVLAGASATPAGTARPAPVATVKQLMDGLIGPASATVYASVSIIVSAEGEKENYPKSEAEWDRVSGAAAALAEAGALLMAEGRARDEDRWKSISQSMIEASVVSMKAAQARDKDALLASGEALNNTCDDCHRIYSVDVE